MHAVLNEIETDILQNTKNEPENGLSNIKDPSTATFQQQMLVLHQSKYISKAGLSSLRQVWAEYKYKVRDASDTHRNIGTSCSSKLKLPNLKILCIKITER